MAELNLRALANKHFSAKWPAIVAAAVLILAAGTFLVFRQKTYPTPEELTDIKGTPFADVNPKDKNFSAIEYLWREGVLTPDKNGNLDPQKVVSRAEWAELLIKLGGLSPDAAKYRDCYADVANQSFAPAVCYAKEQGWIAAATSKTAADFNPSSFFVDVASAQEAAGKEIFLPNEPIKNQEAVGSLARAASVAVSGVEAGKISDEQAVKFAEQANISATGEANGPVTKAEAAAVIFKTVATVGLGEDKYDPKNDVAAKRYSAPELAGMIDNVNPRPSREARIKHWAENSGLGFEAATQVVDGSQTDSEELAKVRKIRYQMRLAEEKRATWGKDTPTFDVIKPLQEIFKKKGFDLTMDDLIMMNQSPTEEEARTNNPVVKARDNVEIRLFLDENYQLIPRAEWGKTKIKYSMKIAPLSMYDTGVEADYYLLPQKGLFVGGVEMFVTDVDTRITKWAGCSGRRWYYLDNPENVDMMYKEAFRKVEVAIGQPIMPLPESKPNDSWLNKIPFVNKNRTVKLRVRPVTDQPINAEQTVWGSADDWETAYEGYFWMHIQSPDQYPTFAAAYGLKDVFGAMLQSLPLGEPVNLRDYFNTAGVRAYYERLQSGNAKMPTLDKFLSEIDSYQSNLGISKAPESAEAEPEKSAGAADPEAAKFEKWMKECYNQPIPQSRAEEEEFDRKMSDPNSPCYSKYYKPCQKAPDGTCLPGTMVNTESR